MDYYQYYIYLQIMNTIQMKAQADQFFKKHQIAKAIQIYKQITQNMLLNTELQSQQKDSFQGLGNLDDLSLFIQLQDISKWFSTQKQKNRLKFSCFDCLSLCFSIKAFMFEGRVWYQNMIKKYKDIYPIIFGLGILLYNSDLIEKSELMFQKAIEIDPKNDKAYLGLMNINFYKKQNEQMARTNALTVLQFNKDSIHAKIVIAFTQQSHIERINKLLLLVASYPQTKSKIYSLMGVLQYRQDNLQKAKQYFIKSIDQRRSVSSLINLASIAYLQQQNQQVQNYCKLIFEFDSHNFEAINLISNVLMVQKRYEESIQWIYGATQIYQKHYLPLYNCANWYYHQGIFDSALQSLAQAESKSKNNKYIQLLKGKCYYQNKQIKQAKQQLQLCYRQNPQFKQVIYAQAKMYFQLQQYQKALNFLLDYSSKVPQNSQILFIIGVCHLNLDKTQLYLEYVLKSINNDMYFMPGYLALGNFYFQTQNYEEAYNYYWKILQINSESQEALEAVSMIKIITATPSYFSLVQDKNQQKLGIITQQPQIKNQNLDAERQISQKTVKEDQVTQ